MGLRSQGVCNTAAPGPKIYATSQEGRRALLQDLYGRAIPHWISGKFGRSMETGDRNNGHQDHRERGAHRNVGLPFLRSQTAASSGRRGVQYCTVVEYSAFELVVGFPGNVGRTEQPRASAYLGKAVSYLRHNKVVSHPQKNNAHRKWVRRQRWTFDKRVYATTWA